MGDFLMMAMIVGAIGGAVRNNTGSSISDTCQAFEDSRNQFNKTKSDWQKILSNQQDIKQKALEFRTTLVQNINDYQARQKELVENYKIQEVIVISTIAIFIFMVIVLFLLRYFNVYGNIWDLIVNKK